MKKEIYILIGLIAILSLAPVLSARAGALTSVTVSPSNANGGYTANYTVSFTTATAIPATGTIKFTFPAGFNVANAATSTMTGINGTIGTSTVSGQVITWDRAGDGTSSATGAKSVIILNIISPSAGGSFTVDVGTYQGGGGASIDTGTSAAFSIIPASDTITKKLYNIDFSASPSGAGIIPGGDSYAEGTAITVNAVPKPGYVFLFWEENGVEISKNPIYSFTIIANRKLVARFRAVEVEVGAPVEKPITEMTVQELEAKIVEVQQKIVDVLQQLIQIFQQRIQGLLAK